MKNLNELLKNELGIGNEKGNDGNKTETGKIDDGIITINSQVPMCGSSCGGYMCVCVCDCL